MKKQSIEDECSLILEILKQFTKPVSIGELMIHLGSNTHKKTLQRRLSKLVETGDVLAEGEKKSRKYSLVQMQDDASYVIPTFRQQVEESKAHVIFSKKSLEKLTYLDTPSFARTKTTYNLELLDKYIPNESQYIPLDLKLRLNKVGKRVDSAIAAGTYAKQIGQRLLIDLSYNSSRLEGNTYSKLDTKRLIEHGLTADGKIHEETVMIMNHKEAISFLIENGEEITVLPFIIRNIHFLLSQDLLSNPKACGKEREIEVSISKSAYKPLNNPHLIREYFELLLLKAEKISDPFEQSFFLLLHLSYLQAFEDVNKRTARLACNIPLIRYNLCPLSFVDVPQEDYFKTLLYFYETGDFQPALELYEWAYHKSCEQYSIIKASLGEIDSFRIQHRDARKNAMGLVIRNNLHEEKINVFLRSFCSENSIEQADKFIAMTLADLDQLHEGAIVSLGITLRMFEKWKALKK